MARHKRIVMETERYVCDVLEEMRVCNKNRNYAGLGGLIEEAQTYVNAMEKGLETHNENFWRRSEPEKLVEAKREKKAVKTDIKRMQEELYTIADELIELGYVPKKDSTLAKYMGSEFVEESEEKTEEKSDD